MFKQDADTGRKYSEDSFTNEKTMRLFGQPDVLCGYDYLQVYQTKAAETPEKRLLVAVLRDAIDCYIQDCLTPERHRIKEFYDAEVWFFRAAGDGIFSLNNVCAVLYLDPGYIRRGLRNYEQKHSRQAKLKLAAAPMRSVKQPFRLAS